MSHYAYEMQDATTRINKKDFPAVLEKIKKEVRNGWIGYGWRKNVLDASTLEEVAKEFDIRLEDEGDGDYRPVIEDVYVTAFFEYLVEIVAPYMTDGEIVVDDEYDVITFRFENGKVSQLYQ